MTIPAIQATTIRGAYDELQPIFKTRARKLQGNTWIRRDGSDIVIKYHDTDILTYHGDDTVTINTDGYHTVTTAERFGNWLPRMWSVRNDRGVWNVFGPVPGGMIENAGMYLAFTYPRTAAHFRIWDGMTITDTPRPLLVNYRSAPDFHETDSLKAELNSMISEYVALYDSERLRELFPVGVDSISVAGDCFFCCMVDSDGVSIPDTGHLLAHMLERYTMVSLIRNAYRHRGYGNSDLVLQLDLTDSQFGTLRVGKIQEHVKRYLLAQLVPHGIPAVTREDLAFAKREVENVFA